MLREKSKLQMNNIFNVCIQILNTQNNVIYIFGHIHIVAERIKAYNGERIYKNRIVVTSESGKWGTGSGRVLYVF